MILGGMTQGGFNNAAATDNPTIEFYPSKSINNGLSIHSNFLHNALNSNVSHSRRKPILILILVI